MVSVGIDTMRSPCSALNVKVVRNSNAANKRGQTVVVAITLSR